VHRSALNGAAAVADGHGVGAGQVTVQAARSMMNGLWNSMGVRNRGHLGVHVVAPAGSARGRVGPSACRITVNLKVFGS